MENAGHSMDRGGHKGQKPNAVAFNLFTQPFKATGEKIYNPIFLILFKHFFIFFCETVLAQCDPGCVRPECFLFRKPK